MINKTENAVAALAAARAGDGELSYYVGMRIHNIHGALTLAKKNHRYGQWLKLMNNVNRAFREFNELHELLKKAERGQKPTKHDR